MIIVTQSMVQPGSEFFLLKNAGSATRSVSASASDVDSPPQVPMDSVDDRVRYITSKSQLDHELDVAGDRLVVLELMAADACETGLFDPEPEDHWTPQDQQKQKKLDVCSGIRHSYVEMAADSPDSRFLAVMVRNAWECTRFAKCRSTV